MKFVVTLVGFFAILLSSIAAAEGDARRLFDNYDPSVAELYSDNAKIHAYRKYPYGTERQMELDGVQWKQLLVRAMPLAKAQNDKSVFTEIVISIFGAGYKIKANRYSNRKCYTDTGYYMVVAPNKDGEFKIIEEYSETQPQSNC